MVSKLNNAKNLEGSFPPVSVSFAWICLKKLSSVMHLLRIVVRWFLILMILPLHLPCQLAFSFVRVLWLHLNNKKPILRNLFLCLSNGVLDCWRHKLCFLFLWHYFAQQIILLSWFFDLLFVCQLAKSFGSQSDMRMFVSLTKLMLISKWLLTSIRRTIFCVRNLYIFKSIFWINPL